MATVVRGTGSVRTRGWTRPCLLALLAGVLCVAASCGHYDSLSRESPLLEQGLTGHQVRITKHDGEIFVFKVARVTDSALLGRTIRVTNTYPTGDLERVNFADIRVVERWQYDRARTLWWVAISGAAAVGLLLWGFYTATRQLG